MKRPDARTRLLVVGKTGTGKSTRLKQALRAWLEAGQRIVAVDPCDEYSRHGRAHDGVTLGPLEQRITAAELAASPHLMLQPRLSLAVVPTGGVREWARAFLLVAELARTAGKPVLLVADEVAAWCDSSAHPSCHRAATALKSLATTGRHQGVALALVSQRAAGIPSAVRAQVNELWAFLQDHPEDLSALAERIGNDNAQAVSRLALGASIEWRDTLTPNPTNKEAPACSPSPA